MSRVTSPRNADREQGHAALFLLVFVVLAVTVALALGDGGALAARRSRAQSIADLVALTAVVHGDERASQVAGDNAAVVTSVVADGAEHEVTIRWEGIVATATASPGAIP